MGVVEVPEVGQRPGQVAVRAGLFRGVARPAGRGQRGPPGLGLVVPAALPVQEDEQRPRQMADVPVEHEFGGELQGGEERGALGRGPGQRLVGCGESGDGHPRAGRAGRHGLDVPVEVPRGGVRGVHVVVDDAVPRGLPVGVDGLAEFGRVGAQQVVAGVAARGVLGQQVGTGQVGQRNPHPRGRDAREAGGGADRALGAGMQPGHQPEQPRRRLVERVVRP
ncbi:hypothetical protein LUX33_28435 [Actinomadura madurae]|uniref:hypothetical protein n=1 Tax=Actinomadura madurae TaxID=1993 RepID=UPI0020D21803|nr:hypothetical protein [Actinomadura madurae]MCP9951979.1 hypothetical protein [Actinomadura madurae]